MVRLKPGDRIDCRVKSYTIVNSYSSYDEVRTFEIVATADQAYYLYVPHYYFLKETIVADHARCQKLGIDKKFLDENIIYIQEGMICNTPFRMDGMRCCKCSDFYSYASANQPDGTLVCYSCRSSPYR